MGIGGRYCSFLTSQVGQHWDTSLSVPQRPPGTLAQVPTVENCILGQSLSASFTYRSHLPTHLPELSGITLQINHLPQSLSGWVLLPKRGTPGPPALPSDLESTQRPLWIPLSFNLAAHRSLRVLRHHHADKRKLWTFFLVRKVMDIIYFSLFS